MKVMAALFKIFLLLFSFQFPAQSLTIEELSNAKFKEEAARHVQYLSALGIRLAGSRNETKAIAYIKRSLKETGLEVKVEPFRFESFILEKAALNAGEEKFEPSLVCFNPYTGVKDIKGEAVYADPSLSREETGRLEAENRILVTTQPANFFQLSLKRPKALVYVGKEDFLRLKSQNKNLIDLALRGEVKKLKSGNVVASLIPRPDLKREIILSAHLDSISGPGADDNASGIAVLLQLAGYFKSYKNELPCRLKFVALGAEEIGMLGSKFYVERHQQELKNCELEFNIDTVGGSEGIYVEMRGGTEGASKEKGKSQYPEDMVRKAAADFEGKWRLLHPSQTIFASCVPDWLKEAIEASGKELGYEITASYMMGSDHRVFAQAGIPATDIAVSGNKHHCPEDIPSQVNFESLQKVARIVAEIVQKTMKRLKEE